MARPPLDPRVAALLPSFQRRARGFASKVAFTLDPDDAAQLACLALWQCAQRAPSATLEQLRAYAWPRARGAILDHQRAAGGGRAHARTEGTFGFSPRLVFGARAVGLLPTLVFTEPGVTDFVCPAPLPDDLLATAREQHARAKELTNRLRLLTARNRAVVCLVLQGVPFHEVAKRFGLSQPRVSQILNHFKYGPRKRTGKRKSRARPRPRDSFRPAA